MERTMIKVIPVLLSLLLAPGIWAKCPPGELVVQIKQANGLLLPLQPDSLASDVAVHGEHYGVIHLGPGDTLQLYRYPGSCGSFGSLLVDGVPYLPFDLYVAHKFTASGSYFGENCDDGCYQVHFTIAPLAGASGSVAFNTGVFLGGAVSSNNSSMMRTDLAAQGLVPFSEPYTGLGYAHTGGGGGEVRTFNFSNNFLVDWVIVELRSAVDPGLVLASRSAILLKHRGIMDAATAERLEWDLPPGYYHVAVKHRNHLGVITAFPILLVGRAPVSFSFAAGSDPIFGEGAQQPPMGGTPWAMWPGNALWTEAPQRVKYTGADNDRDAVLDAIGGSVPTATASGYLVEDLNMDGVVKYTGANNDRDPILQTIGGVPPTAVRMEQVP